MKKFRWTKSLILEKLLTKSDLELTDDLGKTAFGHAVQCNYVSVVKQLIESGLSVESPMKNGETPLLVACGNGFGRMSSLLIEKGAKVDCIGIEGSTPVMRAAASGYNGILKKLIQHGANMEYEDNDQWTALSYAVFNREVEVIQYLLALNVNVNPVFVFDDARTLIKMPYLKDYIERNVSSLNEENLKKWKTYRLQALFK